MDPGVLVVNVRRSSAADKESFDPHHFARWLTCVPGADGCEHAVLSDGYRRIRLDVASGRLLAGAPVVLHYHLSGMASLAPKLLALRQLLALHRHHRFAPTLFQPDPHMDERITVLRVADALRMGASQREIAHVLVGEERIPGSWRSEADWLRSRVRRLIGNARRMSAGGYRTLLKPRR